MSILYEVVLGDEGQLPQIRQQIDPVQEGVIGRNFEEVAIAFAWALSEILIEDENPDTNKRGPWYVWAGERFMHFYDSKRLYGDGVDRAFLSSVVRNYYDMQREGLTAPFTRSTVAPMKCVHECAFCGSDKISIDTPSIETSKNSYVHCTVCESEYDIQTYVCNSVIVLVDNFNILNEKEKEELPW